MLSLLSRFMPAPAAPAAPVQDLTMAVFLDLENIALGARDARYPPFDIQTVLERLLLKGHIVVKKAYCDFERYRDFKRGLHEAAFELIEIPHTRQAGKNSADIRMVVDALDLCYTKAHLDTFVVISGDSDFSPLVSKLRENAKTVIGVGVKNSTSDLFLNNCDEFIYYDDLVRVVPSLRLGRRASPSPASSSSSSRAESGGGGSRSSSSRNYSAPLPATTTSGASSSDRSAATPAGGNPPSPEGGNEPSSTAAADGGGDGGTAASEGPSLEKALDQVVATLDALAGERSEEDPIWASMIKQALKRRNPGFNERAYGFRSFNDLLLEAQKRGLLRMTHDEKSGGYTVKVAE